MISTETVHAKASTPGPVHDPSTFDEGIFRAGSSAVAALHGTGSVMRAREKVPGIFTRRAWLGAMAGGAGMLAFGCGDGAAAPVDTAPGPDDPADAVVRAYTARFNVPGLSLAVARGSTLITARAYGQADVDAQLPMTTSSRLRIASLSKALTSTAVLQLVEAGSLQLSDRVFTSDGLLPEFAGIGPHLDWLQQITVHHLLTHTAGGWSNDDNDPMFQKLGLNQQQLIADTLRTHALDNPPGPYFAYSNFGYCVLGRVIEKVTGLPYAQHVRQRVLQPVHSGEMVIGTRSTAPNEVRYYAHDGGGDPYGIDVARMDAHGGWIASASDLVRCVAGIFSVTDSTGAPALLSSSSLATATQGTTANQHYGCGWMLNDAGNRWHNGSLPGTMSIMVHTATGLSWVALLNTRSGDPQAAGALDSMLWQFVGLLPVTERMRHAATDPSRR